MNVSDEDLVDATRKAGFAGGFKVSAKNDLLIEDSIQFLTEQVSNFELKFSIF